MCDRAGGGAGAVRWLDPDETELSEGSLSQLHCVVRGEEPYRGVFAIRLFPVSHPDRFVSLRYDDPEGKTHEIGVLRDLSGLRDDQRAIVSRSLAKHYHELIVDRIFESRQQHGLLFFDVRTQRGRRSFIMRWQYDRVHEYGARGRIILDVDDNRYIVPDVSALPAADRRRLRRYIYW